MNRKGKGQGNEQVMDFTGRGMVICRWIDTLWVSEVMAWASEVIFCEPYSLAKYKPIQRTMVFE